MIGRSFFFPPFPEDLFGEVTSPKGPSSFPDEGLMSSNGFHIFLDVRLNTYGLKMALKQSASKKAGT